MRREVVVANVMAGPLREWVPLIGVIPVRCGNLALSGVLASQADDVCAAYTDKFVLDPGDEKEERCRRTGQRK